MTKPTLPALTGRDIQRIRVLRDLKQTDVARVAGISVVSLSLLENGHIKMTRNLELRISRALWP